MKLCALLFLVTALSPVVNLGQERLGTHSIISQKIPDTAIVEVILLGAPGIDDEASRWEIAYEFRIATDAVLWEARKQRKLNGRSDERIGELIKQGSVKALVRPAKNRKIVFRIPLSAEIQERLRNHPQDRVQLTAGKITPEVIALSKEQETKSQNLCFYSVIEIYDAKLKKTLLIPVTRVWPYGSYPDAQFEIKVEIKGVDSYSVNSSLPTKTRSEQRRILKHEKTN